MINQPPQSIGDGWGRMVEELRKTWPVLRQFDLEEYRNDLGQLIKDLHRETGLDPEGIRLRIEYIEEKSGFSFQD